ncbi:transcription-repair coupling factor [Thermoleophilia bacterium SCSIO 60948]|nr:transcription-repair coupling factor [Thermoleophilia bacterium SCSIO 60948]
MLSQLLDIARDDEAVGRLAAALGEDGGVEAGVSPSIRPYLLAALLEDSRALGERPALIVCADDVAARDLARSLDAYLAPRRVRLYPSRGTGYGSQVAPPPHLVGLRVGALDALVGGSDGGSAPIVVASAVALAEAVPEARLRPAGFVLHKGEEIDLGDVSELLIEAGYERVDQVDERGQFAVRGDILDVFGATSDHAARLELFGDEIESIRWFSTFTQRSLGEAEKVELDPAAELALEHREAAMLALADDEEDPDEAAAARSDAVGSLPLESFRAPLDLVGSDAAVIVSGVEDVEPALRDNWGDVTTAMSDEDARKLYVEVAAPLSERACLRIAAAADLPDASSQNGDGAVSDAAAAADGRFLFRAQTPASAARSIGEAEAVLDRELRSGYRVVVTFEHRGEAERARYGLARLEARFMSDVAAVDHAIHGTGEGPAPAAERLLFAESRLDGGFVSPQLKLAVLPFRRLVHRRRAAQSGPARGRLASFADLRVGDYVVHADHGIARFAGFETKTLAGVTRDYLQLEYKGADKVYAPTDQLAKITRYVGAGGETPQLSALGSKRWDAVKARARRAARELAGELLNLYAERQARRGHAFAPDGEWQMQLEHSFPYRETADQIESIEAVKADMESERPMDRLICGDVGYGKTEVALRAAFKSAAEGRQVMVLVPTTLLAQQHFGTFTERLADFPLRIEMVSRLRKASEARAAVADFADGKVDILIGTHRLLSRDVRAKELGLVIVDEEQRFGVRQKELLRQLKLRVDVLSMSATPIPRTLQMSMAGLRDISVIETPPEGRCPVRTYVGPYDEALVKRAIEREIEREGQAFFLHNRVETIYETAERLRALIPNARVAVAHGQMDESELEETMLGFLRGGADCLVATTIIESGLDIPAANTLIVERSDHLGLAQAYQIRGRVGRSRERAFAYMLYPSEEALTADAAARLATLSDHTELGSGFAIAMRDLELRGAGDLLGDEQSGHVAAIGFELYVSLLDEAVEALKAGGEPDEEAADSRVRFDVDVDAYVPAEYVPFETAKIDVHRRVAAASEPGELRALGDELRDRFGPLPQPVANLLEMGRARIELGKLGARSVEFRGGRLSITPLELYAAQVGALRSEIPEAMYELRARTVSQRVGSAGAERLEAVLRLARATADALAEPVAA